MGTPCVAYDDDDLTHADTQMTFLLEPMASFTFSKYEEEYKTDALTNAIRIFETSDDLTSPTDWTLRDICDSLGCKVRRQ